MGAYTGRIHCRQLGADRSGRGKGGGGRHHGGTTFHQFFPRSSTEAAGSSSSSSLGFFENWATFHLLHSCPSLVPKGANCVSSWEHHHCRTICKCREEHTNYRHVNDRINYCQPHDSFGTHVTDSLDVACPTHCYCTNWPDKGGARAVTLLNDTLSFPSEQVRELLAVVVAV